MDYFRMWQLNGRELHHLKCFSSENKELWPIMYIASQWISCVKMSWQITAVERIRVTACFLSASKILADSSQLGLPRREYCDWHWWSCSWFYTMPLTWSVEWVGIFQLNRCLGMLVETQPVQWCRCLQSVQSLKTSLSIKNQWGVGFF